jgi:integrase/recombinase XerD
VTAEQEWAPVRWVHHRRTEASQKAITADAVYKIVRGYSKVLGFEIGAHSLRATAATIATNALDHQADIAKVQKWLGHANIARPGAMTHRETQPEDRPTFKVSY